MNPIILLYVKRVPTKLTVFLRVQILFQNYCQSKTYEQNLLLIERSAMGALSHVTDSKGKVRIPPEG